MTPQPAAQPPSVPSVGAGTPGTAETGTGPHEALSRDELLRWVEEAVTGSETDCQAAARELVDTVTDLQRALRYETRRGNLLELRALNAENEPGRLRARLVALESECAALTDALTELAHEFEDVVDISHCYFVVASDDDAETLCSQPFDAPIHRTPARVRAELEER